MKQWMMTGLLCAGAAFAQDVTHQQLQVPITGAPPGTPPMTFDVVINKPQNPDEVVAHVNGKPITAGWIDRMIAAIPGVDSATAQAIDRKQFIERYAVLELLKQEAEKQKLDQKSPLREQLEYHRLTTLAQSIIDAETAGLVADSDRQSYYEKTKEQFFRSKIRMIFVRYQEKQDANGPKAHTPEEAKAIADKAYAELKSGADFAKVAKEYSDEALTRDKGGLYGWVKRSEQMPEEIKSAIFALKTGEIGKPIHMAGNGYYVFRVEETGYAPLSEVASEVDAGVKQQGGDRVMNRVSKEVKVAFDKPDYFQPKKAAAPTAATTPDKPTGSK